MSLEYDEYIEDKEPDFVCKLVVIGDSGVGKSNIISRYTNGTFFENSKSTIGVEFGIKTFEIDDKVIKVTIWDTAGQDRFKCLTKGYYRGSHGAFIVFDITDKNSFDNARKWLDELLESVEDEVEILLVGNKSDMVNERVVSEEMAKRFAKENSLNYIETSAKLGGVEGNIDKAFEMIVTEIYKKEKEKEKEENIEEDDKYKNVHSSEVISIKEDTTEATPPKRKCC